MIRAGYFCVAVLWIFAARCHGHGKVDNLAAESENAISSEANVTTTLPSASAPPTRFSQCPWLCSRDSAASSCGRTWKPVKKVAGGKKIEKYTWPWMGALWSEEKLICGATLICRTWVITAAHCFVNGTQIDLSRPMTLYLGRYLKRGHDKTVKVFNVTENMVIIHEEYNRKKRFNDIALIRLPAPVKFTNKIRPACLPPLTATVPRMGDKCKVAGWGDTMGMGPSNHRLKEATVPIVSSNICKFAYYFSRTQTILCAGGEQGQDTCTGDSGGPLICESPTASGVWELQGIISFGARNCGAEGLPGIYTQVIYFLGWVHRIMEKECKMWTSQRSS